MQRRLLEGNISRLCGEAQDTLSRVRSPLAESKEGAEAEERSESTIDDSTEEKESPEESERSLRSEEEDEEDEQADRRDAVGKAGHKEAGMDRGEEGVREKERTAFLSALQVQCKVRSFFRQRNIFIMTQHRPSSPLFLMTQKFPAADS